MRKVDERPQVFIDSSDLRMKTIIPNKSGFNHRIFVSFYDEKAAGAMFSLDIQLRDWEFRIYPYSSFLPLLEDSVKNDTLKIWKFEKRERSLVIYCNEKELAVYRLESYKLSSNIGNKNVSYLRFPVGDTATFTFYVSKPKCTGKHHCNRWVSRIIASNKIVICSKTKIFWQKTVAMFTI